MSTLKRFGLPSKRARFLFRSASTDVASGPTTSVEADVELQTEWRSLEQRLQHRKPRTDGAHGRKNVKKSSDEDDWHLFLRMKRKLRRSLTAAAAQCA